MSIAQIDQLLSIPTIYQRLFYRTRELTDSSESVIALDLLGGDFLELLEVKMDDEAVELSKLDDSIDEAERDRNRKGGKKGGREEGFGGTGLLGFERSAESTTVSVSSNAVASGSGTRNGSANTIDDGPARGGREDEGELMMAGVMEIDGELSQACSQCTFLQSAENDACEVCGAEL